MEANLVTKLRDREAEEQPIFDMEENLVWPKLIDREVQNTTQHLDVAVQVRNRRVNKTQRSL